ncbi:MAG: hypothetical protein SF051_01330 [Elusimicrobiota bacterium]|nr:hypothetical protein [Elusimicrobiota bacterium]
MPLLLLLLLAPDASANRVVMPRLVARPPVAAFAPAVQAPSLKAALAPLSASAPLLASPPAAIAPAPRPAPADAPAPTPVPDNLLGRTARAMAATSPEDPAWDRAVFEEMFTGRYKGPKPWTDLPDSPKVRVGESLVDRRAPGARELLKTLVLPDERPVLGLFTREGDHVVNGFAMGTQGIYGHKFAVPPGADERRYGGYTFRLALDGTMVLLGSGHLPAELTPRLLRRLKRHYGVTPAVETAWARFRRGLWAAWDGVSAFLQPKS